jgi:hypothetical protein
MFLNISTFPVILFNIFLIIFFYYIGLSNIFNFKFFTESSLKDLPESWWENLENAGVFTRHK